MVKKVEDDRAIRMCIADRNKPLSLTFLQGEAPDSNDVFFGGPSRTDINYVWGNTHKFTTVIPVHLTRPLRQSHLSLSGLSVDNFVIRDARRDQVKVEPLHFLHLTWLPHFVAPRGIATPPPLAGNYINSGKDGGVVGVVSLCVHSCSLRR